MVWVRRGTERREVGRVGQLVDLAQWWLDGDPEDANPADPASAVTQRMDLPTRSRGRDADGDPVDHDAVTQVLRRRRTLSHWVLGTAIDHDAETLRLYRAA
jgi:hypothetical protein